MTGADVAVVESVQTFAVHLMELTFAVLVHQQLADHVQLVLLGTPHKEPTVRPQDIRSTLTDS